MNTERLGPDQLFDSMLMHDDGVVLVVESDNPARAAVELAETADASGLEVASFDLDHSGKAVQDAAESGAGVLLFVEGQAEPDWTALDVGRSRIQRVGPHVLFVLRHAGGLLTSASHLASMVERVVRLDVDASELTEAERAARLDAWRTHYQMPDEELLRRVREGRIPLEPGVVEWLVLLGKADLV